MTKFASIAIIAVAALASFTSGAPVVTAPAVVIPFDPSIVLPTDPINIPTATAVDEAEPTVSIAARADDPFSSAVTSTGRATWFVGTYGACNINWDGNTQPIVALNAWQMGPESWGNPVCGRKVHITNTANGKSVVATIVDKCPGDECAWGSLDLSPAAFNAIGNQAQGVLSISWNYV
ncbi:hypothetical protein BGZ99_005303 [Dissophora globulifera]|uniref:RlpA-like protein double-psi beta-barrel domain-containing protein n=1 Tax=Dissophora globulifera TaxID=979702 RepID=A0A9P6RVA7_9FUNG|nr:hypothetical protein BGZ99_005303 [Dissophora globulifera]